MDGIVPKFFGLCQEIFTEYKCVDKIPIFFVYSILMETIKDIFRETRKNRGLSQYEMAALLGVSRVSISLYETGKAIPRSEKLLAVMRLREFNVRDCIKKSTK